MYYVKCRELALASLQKMLFSQLRPVRVPGTVCTVHVQGTRKTMSLPTYPQPNKNKNPPDFHDLYSS